jgi:hypothetical protein
MSIQVLFKVRQQHYQTSANSQVVTCLEISKITPWQDGTPVLRQFVVKLFRFANPTFRATAFDAIVFTKPLGSDASETCNTLLGIGKPCKAPFRAI